MISKLPRWVWAGAWALAFIAGMIMNRFALPALIAALALAFAKAGIAREPARRGAAATAEIDRGRQVFAKHCQQCHPNGGAGIGPSLRLKAVGSFRMKTQIRMGKGKMPAFTPSQIDRDDLQRLVAYLQTLPAPVQPASAGKAKRSSSLLKQ